jgi:Amino-transferase class IV
MTTQAGSIGASAHESLGKLVPRTEAVVWVFDAGCIRGEGVWEGLRVHNGGIAFLNQHLERPYEGARALRIDIGMSPASLAGRLFECLAANKMENGVHIRLMVTRGVKRTPYQDPRVTTGSATIVTVPLKAQLQSWLASKQPKPVPMKPLMLDARGHVATCNSTHFIIVSRACLSRQNHPRKRAAYCTPC